MEALTQTVYISAYIHTRAYACARTHTHVYICTLFTHTAPMQAQGQTVFERVVPVAHRVCHPLPPWYSGPGTCNTSPALSIRGLFKGCLPPPHFTGVEVGRSVKMPA